MSSSYKTYNRQPRTLTEESGFAGGMYWTNNNVDATHLKAIVNFDCDDTTGFLKTRQPLGYEPLYDSSHELVYAPDRCYFSLSMEEVPLRIRYSGLLNSMSFLGAYSINAYTQTQNNTQVFYYSKALDACVKRFPKTFSNDDENVSLVRTYIRLLTELYGVWVLDVPEAVNEATALLGETPAKTLDAVNKLKSIDFAELYNELSDTGVLYLFGTVEQDIEHNVQTCNNIQAFYKTIQGDYYSVDCSEINLLLETVPLQQTGVLHFGLHDNTLYCTTSDTTRAFCAFRLLSFADANSKTPLTLRLSMQPYANSTHHTLQRLSIHQYPWQTYEYLINQTTLLEASVSGFNAARGDNIFSYQSNEKYDVTSPRILGVWFTSPDAANAVITEPRIGQRVRMNIAINGYNHQNNCVLSGDNPSHAVFVFKKIESSVDEKYDAELIHPEAPQFHYDENAGAVVVDYTFTGDTNIFEIVIAYRQTEQVTIDYNSEDIIARQIINVSFNSASSTTKLKPYKLHAVKAHCVWNGHYCLWDADVHPNTLFLSYKDNFYYYPVPHNVLLFDSTIVNCVPYLDSLLVFTTNKLYQITETAEGVITQSVIQNDLPVDKVDASYLQVIKNMVLFKSGRYFYMVVPKSQSLKGELTVAPIYKNISGFLDNMKSSVLELLQSLYPERDVHIDDQDYVVSQHPTSIYAEQDTVRILYHVGTRNNNYTLFLNYNTNLRAWTIYLEDTTDNVIRPTVLAPSREMSFIRMSTDSADIKTQDTVSSCTSYTDKELYFDNEDKSQIALCAYEGCRVGLLLSCKDAKDNDAVLVTTGVVHTDLVSYPDDYVTPVIKVWVVLDDYVSQLLHDNKLNKFCIQKDNVKVRLVYGPPMYSSNKTISPDNPDTFRCLLDSGYRTLASSLKKRFREIQLKVYCPSEELTQFGSAFFVDGVERRNYTSLKESKLDDHTVTLAPGYDCNTFITEPTMGLDAYGQPVYLSKEQGSDGIELDNWSLDFSHFKREAPTTIRIPVSGKGYNPRFVLMSPSTSELQINSINWVYRTMNAR